MLAKSLAFPVTLLCRQIFSSGSLPTEWKTAIVTPIFKKGCASNVKNYRPISLTCVACKVFESVIKENILLFLKRNKILNESQHGFLVGHSTSTNLLESLNDWTISLKNGHLTRIITIDFARAFDTICYSKLLFKLGLYGFRGNLLKIIESFLSNRSQCENQIS